jgi:hypothetical protein
MIDNTKWLEPRDEATDDPERDIIREVNLLLTLDSEGMWVAAVHGTAAYGTTESIGYMYADESVKDLFQRL